MTSLVDIYLSLYETTTDEIKNSTDEELLKDIKEDFPNAPTHDVEALKWFVKGRESLRGIKKQAKKIQQLTADKEKQRQTVKQALHIFEEIAEWAGNIEP